jgi:ParB family chromosome partitioning protein
MSTDDPLAPRAARRSTGLGRGLSALFAETKQDVALNEAREAANASGQMAGRSISPHPDQPRRRFDEAALQELADSIGARGVIQPIIVRPAPNGGDRYQIVAGERRWRAAQRAQLHRIPAIVRDFDEAETLEIAIVENIQREDLNPIEEAQAYRRLVGQFGHSQDALGRLVGKSRSHVANLMRLLELPGDVQELVLGGSLGMGHARTLIGAPDCGSLAQEVVRKGLSVRETEQLVRSLKGGGRTRKAAPAEAAFSGADNADIAMLERDLADRLGMRVSITHAANGKGSMTVHYSTLDQLDMLCLRLSGDKF